MSTLKKTGIYFLFALNLGIILIFWLVGSLSYLISGPANQITALGRLFGLLAVYAVLLQFILMGRAVWIEQLFGQDKLARVHRLNGYFSIFFILIHFILITIAYAMMAKVNFLAQFLNFIFHYDGLFAALLSVIIFISIVFLSIYIVRKHLKYETWFYIHLLTYLAIVFAWGHQIQLGGDFFEDKFFVVYWYALYLFVFGNVLIYRFGIPIFNSLKQQFVVSDVVQETPDSFSIYIQGRDLKSFKAKPGQFITLRFLAEGFWWETHPFSFSAVPNEQQLRITVKNCGDFSAKIGELKKGTKILIEGPYGILTAEPQPETKYLFIAGGVGITPLRALIEQIAPVSNLILLYNNKTQSDVIFQNELDALSAQYKFPIHYVMSNQPDFAGEKGRIDQEKITRLVPDLAEREVYFCGPQAMLTSMHDILGALGVDSQKIHYERFSF